MDNVYEINGYASRREYLYDLADSMDIERATVLSLADLLGETEDFDGLVSTLEDYSDDMDY